MSEKIIPEGYRENYRGDLVREDSIKDIDLVRDRLTIEIVQKAQAMHDLLAKCKAEMMADIEAFVSLSAEQYGVNWGGKKGGVTLASFDGRYKVILSIADVIVFDERLQVAKELINECLLEWSTGAHKGLVTLVNDAFRTDANGNLRTNRVLGLRRHNIDDPRWMRAMDAIADALQVVGSNRYIRVYERVGTTEKYDHVPLDIASV